MSLSGFLNNGNSSNADTDITPVTTSPTVLYLFPKTNSPEKRINKENENSINSVQEKPDPKDPVYNEKRPFSCDTCNKTFKRGSHLKIHLFTHKDEKPHKCDVCGKFYSHPYFLKMHAQIHFSEKRFSCDICNKKFSVRRYFTRHMRRHKSKYTCDACDFICCLMKDMNNHVKTHDVGSFSCDKCNRLFCKETSRDSHECYEYDIKRHSCTLCSKTFKRLEYLNIHLAKHADDRSFVCDICNKGFYYKQGLNSHMETHFQTYPENPLSCPTCDKKFPCKYKLKYHMLYHKRKQTPHKNPSEKKVQENQLQGKIGVLNIEYPVNISQPIFFIPGKHIKYVCDICLKGFRFKHSLVCHYRSHTGERPFECEVCSRRFSAKTDLKRHFRIHTGERKYACLGCGKTFTRKTYMTSHIQKCIVIRKSCDTSLPKIVSVYSENQNST